MTTATIWKNEEIYRVCVNGHSGYSKSGTDIVCSSISTATILTANIISSMTNNCIIKFDEKNVNIDIQITDKNISNEISIVMNSFVNILEDISNQYPKHLLLKYVK